jgi:hypothetical protein
MSSATSTPKEATRQYCATVEKKTRGMWGHSGRKREALLNQALTWLTERQQLLLRATAARFEFTFHEYLVL